MRVLSVSLLLLCAAISAAEAADLTKLKELFSRRREVSKTQTRFAVKDPNLAYQVARQRATLVTSADVVLPVVVNAEGVVTRIRLVNMENRPVELEMFFVDLDGFEADLDIRGSGNVDSLKLTLAVGGGRTIETTGRGDDQLVWAFFDAGRNNVGATATIEIADDTGVFACSYSAQFLGDTRVRASFDNTNGSETEVDVINVNTDDSEVSVTVRGEDGSSLFSGRERIPALGSSAVKPGELARGAINARGTVELSVPASSRGGLAVVSVQFFDPFGINILPGFATVN